MMSTVTGNDRESNSRLLDDVTNSDTTSSSLSSGSTAATANHLPQARKTPGQQQDLQSNQCWSTDLAEQVGLPKDRFPCTPQELDLAEQALEQELKNLTLDEQEKVLFDIHGLPVVQPQHQQQKYLPFLLNNDKQDEPPFEESDDPVDLPQRIVQVRQEIRKLDCDKHAWQEACYYNQDFVDGDESITMFLRAHQYDPVNTAARIVAAYACKEMFFGGGEILGRDIRLSDLTEEELAFLDNGVMQVLPTRDISGRTVVWAAGLSHSCAPLKSLVSSRFSIVKQGRKLTCYQAY